MRADVRRASILLLAALTGPLHGQTRVTLQSGHQPTPLEQACMQLGQMETRAAGLRTLVQAGAVAAPLLVAAAQRDNATSLPALRALAAMGGTARCAAGPLANLTRGTSPLARAAAEALAAIGERDTVLAADWRRNRIVELDSAGKQLREVAVEGPWSIQPIAGDRLLVCCYQAGKVVELKWDGTLTELPLPKGNPICARRLVDGTTIVALMEAKVVIALDAGGKETWQLPIRARAFVVLENDNLLLLDDKELKVREITTAGTVVREFTVAANPLSLDRRSDGSLLLQHGDALLTLDALGQKMRTDAFTGTHARATPDGGLVCATDSAVILRDPQGAARWTFEGSYFGDVIARIAPR